MRTKDQIALVALYQVMTSMFVSASFVLTQKTVDAQPTTSERISGSWEAIPGTYGGARGGTDQDEFLNFARIQRTGNTVIFETIAIDVGWYQQVAADCETGQRRILRRGRTHAMGSSSLSEILESGQQIEIRLDDIEPFDFPDNGRIDPTVRRACMATENSL